MNFPSIVDEAIIVCILLLQDTTSLAKKNMYAKVVGIKLLKAKHNVTNLD